MLDKTDLDTLKNMMESVIDERLEKSEASILEKVDERFEKLEGSMMEKMEESLEKSETSIWNRVNKRLERSEGFLLDEIERTRNILEDKISKVQSNLDELNQYYRITRLENDNTVLLLKMIEDLEKRMVS